MTQIPALPPRPLFLSAHLADRGSGLLTEEVALLRDCVALARARWDFRVAAAVVLPSEVQMIWHWPGMAEEVMAPWRLIRSTFARHTGARWDTSLAVEVLASPAEELARRGWLERAPVRAGLARRAQDWRWSSAWLRERSVAA
jgi:putative transposase